MAQHAPSSEEKLEALMIDFQHSLEQSRLLTCVCVRGTGDLNRMIEATCQPASETLTISELTAEIECLWLEGLRFRHFEAHAIRCADDHAILDFITATQGERILVIRDGEGRLLRVSEQGGIYVNGSIAVDVSTIQGSMGTVAFWYRLTGRGCSQAGILDGVNHAFLTASYLSDAPRDLTHAVIALLSGAERSRCSFASEPGEHRWIFGRQDERLRISVLWFADDPIPPEPDQRGEQIFSTECELRQFAGQLRSVLRRLLDDHGLEGYRRVWGYDFPMAEYRTLEALLGREEAGSG